MRACWKPDSCRTRKPAPRKGASSPPCSRTCTCMKCSIQWFEREVKPRLQGRSELIRYADDFVIVLRTAERRRARDGGATEAIRQVRTEAASRQDASRRVQRPESKDDGPPSHGGTFDFLGFTHYWGKSRKGHWVVMRKTAKNRLARAIGNVHLWRKSNRHQPVSEQHRALAQKLRGHYSYYGITGNMRSLSTFHLRCHADLAQLARQERRQAKSDLDPLRTASAAISAAAATHRAQHPSSEPIALKSRMREIRTSGSVGAPPSNRRGHPSEG